MKYHFITGFYSKVCYTEYH